MSLFWGLHAGYNDNVAKQAEFRIDAREAKSQSREAREVVGDFERRLDKLVLISMAVWSLLSEKMHLTEEDLMERVKTIDLMDGKADGKLKRELAQCSQCNRVMNPRHTKCIYCGADRLHLTAFDDVV